MCQRLRVFQLGVPGAVLTYEFINNHLSVISILRPDGGTRWQMIRSRYYAHALHSRRGWTAIAE